MSHCGTQFTNADNKDMFLCDIYYVHWFCRPTAQLQNYSTLLVEYLSGKWNWTFCVNMCTDGAAAMTGRLSGFTICKNIALECEATQCVIQENFLIF